MVDVLARLDDAADELPELDLEEHPDASLAALAASTPSADTVVFSTFADPERLSPSARIDLLQVLTKQAAWIEARQLELLAVIDAADPSPDRWATEEIAAVLRIAPATATVRVAQAQLLAGPLLVTRQALLGGQITARPARTSSNSSAPVVRMTGNYPASVIRSLRHAPSWPHCGPR
jgi:hypothetical protein